MPKFGRWWLRLTEWMTSKFARKPLITPVGKFKFGFVKKKLAKMPLFKWFFEKQLKKSIIFIIQIDIRLGSQWKFLEIVFLPNRLRYQITYVWILGQ